MPLVMIGGLAPDYPGENYETISGLLARVRDVMVLGGWTTTSDQIASNQLIDMRSASTNINTRISFVGNQLFIRGDNDGLGTVLSDEFNCGFAVDNDPNRLYMCIDDDFVGLGVWSNNINQMGMGFAGYPEVWHDDTILPYPWYVGRIHSDAAFNAQVNLSAYNSRNWVSFRQAQNFAANLDIETSGTNSFFKAGTYDRYTTATPYNNDPDVGNQENAGSRDFRGNTNGLDNKAVLSSFWIVEGRDDDVPGDGQYRTTITRNGLEFGQQSFYRGKYTTYLNVGGASYQQRTIIEDEITGRIYVTGPVGYQCLRIA